jgi:hypothetical protein
MLQKGPLALYIYMNVRQVTAAAEAPVMQCRSIALDVDGPHTYPGTGEVFNAEPTILLLTLLDLGRSSLAWQYCEVNEHSNIWNVIMPTTTDRMNYICSLGKLRGPHDIPHRTVDASWEHQQ